MNSTPFLIDCLVNPSFFVQSLIDTGCLCYAVFSNELVNNNKLPRIPIEKRSLHLAKKRWKTKNYQRYNMCNP